MQLAVKGLYDHAALARRQKKGESGKFGGGIRLWVFLCIESPYMGGVFRSKTGGGKVVHDPPFPPPLGQ